MKWRCLRKFPVLVGLFFLGLLPACLEKGVEAAQLEEKVKELDEEFAYTMKYLQKAEVKLANYQKIHEELKEAGRLKSLLKEMAAKSLEIVDEIAELKGERELTLVALAKVQRKQRIKAREEARGQMIDLSSFMGEEYKSVRIYRVLPIGLRVYLPAGPKTVGLEKLPEEIKERFLMSAEEAARYRERLAANAQIRTKNYREWRAKVAKRNEAEVKVAARTRITDLESRIDRLDGRITLIVNRVAELKSEASAWERKSFEVQGKSRKKSAIRYALAYREKAEVLNDQKSEIFKAISGIRSEVMKLEALEKSGR